MPLDFREGVSIEYLMFESDIARTGTAQNKQLDHYVQELQEIIRLATEIYTILEHLLDD